MENNTNQSGTQNRNRSRNRNQNRNRGGSGGQNRRNNSSNSNRSKQGGSNNRNRNRNRTRKPKVIVLTPMQKFIKAITFGAIDPNKKPAKSSRPSTNRASSQRKPAESKPSQPARGKSKNPPKVYEVTSPRLYVGNLDYDAGESELEDLFRGVGNVINAEVVTNARTQQSKGFAFVEMGSIEEAKRAVEVLHDQEFMSRKLLVSGAKSDGPRDRSDSDDSDEAAA